MAWKKRSKDTEYQGETGDRRTEKKGWKGPGKVSKDK